MIKLEREMERIVYDIKFKINYDENFKKAVQKLCFFSSVPFENVDVIDIIEMFNIALFFEDGLEVADDKKKQILEENKECYKKLRKTINLYFQKANSDKIREHFIYVKENSGKLFPYRPHHYFETLVANYEFKKDENLIFKTCVRYISFSWLIKNKKFAEAFQKEIKDELLNCESGIEFVVDKYDNLFEHKYYLPKFNESEIEKMVLNYINSRSSGYHHLYLLSLHKNNKGTYILSDTAKVSIKEALDRKNLEAKLNADLTFHFVENFCLKKPQMIKELETNSLLSNNSNKHISFEEVLVYLLDSGVFVNKLCFIADLPNKFENGGILEHFKSFHKEEYDYDDSVLKISLEVFSLIYHEFENGNIHLEDVAQWFVENKINQLLNGSKINLSDLLINANYLVKCEHMFSQIYSLLLQYKIYVENKTITSKLIEVVRESKIEDIPSLIKDKYVDINPNSKDAEKIMRLLFSDQAGINYISEELNESNFFDLIVKHQVSYSSYTGELKKRIDFLAEKKIIRKENNFLTFYNSETASVWSCFRLFMFLNYYKLNLPEKKLIDEGIEKNMFRRYSSLFSKDEADYLNFILNNSKFSNSLGLRNRYAHGAANHLDEGKNKYNYLIGLRTLFLILFKIHCDLIGSKQQG